MPLMSNFDPSADIDLGSGLVKILSLAMNRALTKILFLTLILPLTTNGAWILDSITRGNSIDYTCHNNARAVVSDPAGNIHIVWRGKAPDTFQVWYSCWDWLTREWSNDTLISADPGSAGDPAIACDSSGNIYVAWITSGIIKLKRRNSLTGEWEALESLISNQEDSAISAAIDRNGVQHFVWTGKTPTSSAIVLYTTHTNEGWTQPETVALIPQYQAVRPAIACSPSGTVMSTWYFNQQILARRRLLTGWAQVETVFTRPGSGYSSICFGQDSFYVVWVSGTPSNQSVIYRARGLAGWGDTFRLNSWQRGKFEPSVVSDGRGGLHFAWIDERPADRKPQLCYRWRTPDGTWDTIQVLTSEDVLRRERLSISAGNGTVQIAWTDILSYLPGITQIRLGRYEPIHDIGVLSIIQPQDTVDSARQILPVALIKNTGDIDAESVRVFFKIGDSLRMRTVEHIRVNESIPVIFDSIFIAARNRTGIICSTYLRDDAVRSNDVLKETVFVRVRNVVLESIIAPGNRIVQESIRPEISIHNAGNVNAYFTAHCSIFSLSRQQWVYDESLNLRLAPGASRNAPFPVLNVEPGAYYLRFRLNLNGDLQPQNDTAGLLCQVLFQDLGVENIIWPVDTVDTGTTGYPQVKIKNYGEEPATAKIRLVIGDDYCDTAFVFVQPGESVQVAFDQWAAITPGSQVVRCSTMFAGDRNNQNDTLSANLFVRINDAGIQEIGRPSEVNSPGVITPEVRIKNFGNQTISVPVYLVINRQPGTPVYADSVFVTGLLPEQESLIVFTDWQAAGGTYYVSAWTGLINDINPANDTMGRLFRVTTRDAAVLRIVAPQDTVIAEAITPVSVVRNLGETAAGFYSFFTVISSPAPNRMNAKFSTGPGTEFETALLPLTITEKATPAGTPVYLDSVFIYLEPGDSAMLNFCQWRAQPGTYELAAWTVLSGDENPDNDSVSAMCYVESLSTRRWRQLISIPAGRSNKPVRGGGCLVSAGSRIYAFKGASTNEFWTFEPRHQEWSAAKPLPSGYTGKKIRAGAALCWDGENRIYALKGNNTREFWCYDIVLDSWIELPRLPDWTAGIRFGSGLAYVAKRDTNKVFCLKGSGTTDFLVYWIKQGEWHSRRPVPRGPMDKPVRRGSALTAHGNRIFVLKGWTNEFFEYIVNRDSWRSCAPLPMDVNGRVKKSRDGAALTSDQTRYIYAFKGGRTTEFWRYDVIADTWERLEDIPPGDRWHRVNTGGALTFLEGAVYGFKGGGSREFWRYEVASIQVKSELPASFADSQSQVSCFLNITGLKKLNFRQQPLIIFDPSGRRRREERLKPGVYFVLFSERTGKSSVKKLIILNTKSRAVPSAFSAIRR
jgi:hypothetical protein